MVPAGFNTGFPTRAVLGLQRSANPPARGLSDERHRHRQGTVLSRLSQAARSRETESQALVVLRLMPPRQALTRAFFGSLRAISIRYIE